MMIHVGGRDRSLLGFRKGDISKLWLVTMLFFLRKEKRVIVTPNDNTGEEEDMIDELTSIFNQIGRAA